MIVIKISIPLLLLMCLTTSIVMGCSGGGDGKSDENSGIILLFIGSKSARLLESGVSICFA